MANRLTKGLRSKVESMMRAFPKSRESDVHLYYEILRLEGLVPSEMTAVDLLKKVYDGRLPSFDTVTRMRRKIQEHTPDLRGANWSRRHKFQTTIRNDLKKVI